MKKLMVTVMCICILLAVTGCEYLGTGLGIDENGKIVPLEDVINNKTDLTEDKNGNHIGDTFENEIESEVSTTDEDNLLYDCITVQYGGSYWDATIPAEEVPRAYFNLDLSKLNTDTLTNIVNTLVNDFNIEVNNDVSIFNGDVSESVTKSSSKGLAMASVRKSGDGQSDVLEVQAKITSDKPIENIDVLNTIIVNKMGIDVNRVDGFKDAVQKVLNAEYDYAKINVATQKKYESFSLSVVVGKGEGYTYEYIVDLCIEL